VSVKYVLAADADLAGHLSGLNENRHQINGRYWLLEVFISRSEPTLN
jgi:hypothetical protein